MMLCFVFVDVYVFVACASLLVVTLELAFVLFSKHVNK
jgi:hypothetical protein